MRVSSDDPVSVVSVGLASSPSVGRSIGPELPGNESEIAVCFYVARRDPEIVGRSVRSVARSGCRIVVFAGPGASLPPDLPKTARVVRSEGRFSPVEGFFGALSAGLSFAPEARFLIVSQDDAEYEPWAVSSPIYRGLKTEWASMYTPDHIAALLSVRNRWVPMEPPQGGHMSAVSLGFTRRMAVRVLADIDRVLRLCGRDGYGLDSALATVFRGFPISYHVPSPCQHIGTDRLPVRRATIDIGKGLPPYDVVVPYRDWYPDHLDAVLQACRTSGHAPRSIIVVDYGSVRDREVVREIAARHGAKLIRRDAPCWCRPDANNTGLLHVKAPYVAFMDSDCVASPALFRAALEELERCSGRAVALATTFLSPMGWTPPVTGRERSFPAVTRRSQGGFLMCRTEAVLEAGAYRRSLCVWGVEDNDMVDRLAARGNPPLWVTDIRPEAFLVHMYHPTSVTTVNRTSAASHLRANQLVYRLLHGRNASCPSGGQIAVSILSFGRYECLRRSISSVLEHLDFLRPRFYVGWSHRRTKHVDGLIAALRRDGHVAIVLPFACPQGMARNILHGLVREPFVLHLDDDMYLDAGSRLDRAFEVLLSGWDMVCVACREGAGFRDWWGRIEVTEGVARIRHNNDELCWAGRWRVVPVDCAPNCWVARTEVVRDIPQDWALGSYGHHLEWMLRLRKAGRRVCYTEDSYVCHLPGGDEQYRMYRHRRTPAADRFASLTGIRVMVDPKGVATTYAEEDVR